MYKTQIKLILAGLIIAFPLAARVVAQTSAGNPPDPRVSAMLKLQQGSSDEREAVVRLHQQGEALRASLFEVMVREMDLESRVEDLDFRLTPYGIQRALAFEGSTRPMDELEQGLRRRLENQKARVNKLLEYLVASRERLEAAIRETDAEIDLLRQRLSSTAY